MTHEEIKILISAYFDGEVTPSEKAIVEEHLSSCQSCQKDLSQYKAMSSSLSKWSNETLSPDEEINVQRSFEQRREPMFTKRTLLTFASTLAIAIIVGSVVQSHLIKGQLQSPIHGYLKSSADDIGDQYSDGNTNRLAVGKVTQYEPYYQQANYNVNSGGVYNKRLGSGLVLADNEGFRQKTEEQGLMYAANARADSFGGLRKEAFANNNLKSELMGAVAGRPFIQAQSMPVSTTAASDKSFGSINGPVMEERKVITNEEITLQVLDAEKAQNELDGLVSRYDGIVLNFNINKLNDGSRSGLFVFKVLPKDLKNVLREVRRLGEVQAENQSGEDITNQYEYLQARMVNYEKAKEQLNKVLAKNLNNVDNNLNIQAQLAGVQSNIDSLTSSIRQYDDQSYMATVVVNFYDVAKTVVVKTMSFKERFMQTVKDNLKSTLQTTYELGINSFSGIFIIMSFLFQILLWALAIWGVYHLIKWMIKK